MLKLGTTLNWCVPTTFGGCSKWAFWSRLFRWPRTDTGWGCSVLGVLGRRAEAAPNSKERRNEGEWTSGLSIHLQNCLTSLKGQVQWACKCDVWQKSNENELPMNQISWMHFLFQDFGAPCSRIHKLIDSCKKVIFMFQCLCVKK